MIANGWCIRELGFLRPRSDIDQDVFSLLVYDLLQNELTRLS